MRRLNHQGTDQLRKGRISIPGAAYFITLCAVGRRTGLHHATIAEGVIDTIRTLHQSGDIEFRCSTVMPDHLHLLCKLGNRLSLSRAAGKLKGLTKACLSTHGLLWQENFYDHRLRQNGFLEDFARYIFLNPYRKSLISCHEIWPWWSCNPDYQPAFCSLLIDGIYPPQPWIGSGPSAKNLVDQDVTVPTAQQPNPVAPPITAASSPNQP